MGNTGEARHFSCGYVGYSKIEEIGFSTVKIYVAGHRGLVGSSIVKHIELETEHSWIGKSRSELDLLDRKSVFDFLNHENPDAVIIAAAKVGGIYANKSYPVEFLSHNLQIETNLMDGAHSQGVAKLLFLGSSCVYPKLALQPIKEEYLLSGPLEKTNEAYALAKISGLKLVQAYRIQYGHRWISAMPTNLYGPGDSFDLDNSHVLPALIRKFDDAKSFGQSKVTLWGTGKPKREFLHANDFARACVTLLERYDDDSPINVGFGEDISIKDLAELVKEVTGFTGEIEWDESKPDGTPRKFLDSSRILELGWQPRITLRQGIHDTYLWFLGQKSKNEAK
jgi:GDP-L-fucose synthase